MENDFRIRICSDLDYEKMVVDVSWNNNTVAMLTQESGPTDIEIKIFAPPDEMLSWDFPLDKFIETLSNAKAHLVETT